MADPNAPAAGSSVTINDKRNAPSLGNVVEQPAAKQEQGAQEQTVMVKALKYFPDKDKDGNPEQKGPDSEPFPVARSRAAQLYANGLIEYASADDEEKHLSERAREAGQAARDRLKADRDARSTATSKVKPLVNPKVEMASESDAKR